MFHCFGDFLWFCVKSCDHTCSDVLPKTKGLICFSPPPQKNLNLKTVGK